MSITFTKGSEWWLDRTTKQGRERYPKSIIVGQVRSKAVRYVPEKTCFCPHCGAKVVSK